MEDFTDTLIKDYTPIVSTAGINVAKINIISVNIADNILKFSNAPK